LSRKRGGVRRISNTPQFKVPAMQLDPLIKPTSVAILGASASVSVRHDSLDGDLNFEMAPWDMRKPVIASIQGHALGARCKLTMFCYITVAVDKALLSEPEIHFSSAGPAIIMPWMIGYKKARELLYFGDMTYAEEAERLAMVNHVVPLDELQERTMKFAKRMAFISPEALEKMKLAINCITDSAGSRNTMKARLDIVARLYAEKTKHGENSTKLKNRRRELSPLASRTPGQSHNNLPRP
jgi:enoyl-CoA hydratase/carnithine racemase